MAVRVGTELRDSVSGGGPRHQQRHVRHALHAAVHECAQPVGMRERLRRQRHAQRCGAHAVELLRIRVDAGKHVSSFGTSLPTSSNGLAIAACDRKKKRKAPFAALAPESALGADSDTPH